MPAARFVAWCDALRGHHWIATVAVGCLAFTTGVAVLVQLGLAGLDASVTRDIGNDHGEVVRVVGAKGGTLNDGRVAMEALDHALGDTRRSRIERRMIVLDVIRRHHAVELVGVAAVFPGLQRIELASGRWFTDREDSGMHDVAVLGRELVDSVYHGEVPRRVRVAERWLQVIGVVATGPASAVPLNESIIVPVRLLGRLVPAPVSPPELLVAAVDGAHARASVSVSTLDDTWAVLDRRPRFRGRLVRESSVDRLGEAARLSGTLRGAANRLAIVLLAASLAAVTALLLTIARGQSRAVGIRRAVGATRAWVVLQGAWVGTGIGLVGVAIGVAVALIIAQVLFELAEFPALSQSIVLDVVLQASVLPLATCIVVGALCFARLTRQTPARLLA